MDILASGKTWSLSSPYRWEKLRHRQVDVQAAKPGEQSTHETTEVLMLMLALIAITHSSLWEYR